MYTANTPVDAESNYQLYLPNLSLLKAAQYYHTVTTQSMSISDEIEISSCNTTTYN